VLIVVLSQARNHRPKIPAAVDPSHAYSKPLELDREILRCGRIFADALHGALHALDAFDPLPTGGMASEAPFGEASEVIDAVTEGRARKNPDRVLNGTAIPPSRRHLIPRHPIDAIEGVAREIGGHIVIMGAVSRSGLKRLALGNTAERVLDHL